jgi:hypothetical protein
MSRKPILHPVYQPTPPAAKDTGMHLCVRGLKSLVTFGCRNSLKF